MYIGGMAGIGKSQVIKSLIQFFYDLESFSLLKARSYQPQLLDNAFIDSLIHGFGPREQISFLRKYKTIPNNSKKIT